MTPMVVLLIIHSIQAVSCLVFTFGIKNNRQSALFCLIIGSIVPFLMFIYIILAVILTTDCDGLVRTWIITDCIVFAFTVLSFLKWSYHIFQSRSQYSL